MSQCWKQNTRQNCLLWLLMNNGSVVLVSTRDLMSCLSSSCPPQSHVCKFRDVHAGRGWRGSWETDDRGGVTGDSPLAAMWSTGGDGTMQYWSWLLLQDLVCAFIFFLGFHRIHGLPLCLSCCSLTMISLWLWNISKEEILKKDSLQRWYHFYMQTAWIAAWFYTHVANMNQMIKTCLSILFCIMYVEFKCGAFIFRGHPQVIFAIPKTKIISDIKSCRGCKGLWAYDHPKVWRFRLFNFHAWAIIIIPIVRHKHQLKVKNSK